VALTRELERCDAVEHVRSMSNDKAYLTLYQEDDMFLGMSSKPGI
jgi:hypothetical protein